MTERRDGDRADSVIPRAHTGVPDTPLIRTCRTISAEPQTVELADGRRLGYADVGDPDGTPLVLNHGFPNSRVFAAVFDDVGQRLGVRILAPERPGIGVSDPLPGRTLADWASDVSQLLDALDLQSAPVLGVSAGGPYALACAAELPKRVSRVGAICPIGPHASLRFRKRLPFLLGTYLPTTWKLAAWKRRRKALSDPASFLDSKAAEAPEPDRDLWRGEFGHALLLGTLEGSRNGLGGYKEEAKVLCARWDVDLGGISAPVVLRHGEADQIVPVEMGRAIADAVCDADVAFPPDLGHLAVIEETKEAVVRALTDEEGGVDTH